MPVLTKDWMISHSVFDVILALNTSTVRWLMPSSSPVSWLSPTYQDAFECLPLSICQAC